MKPLKNTVIRFGGKFLRKIKSHYMNSSVQTFNSLSEEASVRMAFVLDSCFTRALVYSSVITVCVKNEKRWHWPTHR